MRYARLSDWLVWQEKLHPTAVDLGAGTRAESCCKLLPAAA